jgi:hypothetical protein
MTTFAEHTATVLPFRHALLRAPTDRVVGIKPEPSCDRSDAPLPDNVVSLAQCSRRARRANRRYWLGGPPEGEAA